MGPPGGGKGTISKKLIKDFGYHHVSTGDMLRAHIRAATALGNEAKSFMDKGDFVPDLVVISMVIDEIKKTGKDTHLLLDGFPRTLAQAESLGRSVNVEVALNLNVPSEEIIGRISNRWTHLQSGRVYAYDFNPPKVEGKDDETGEDLIQRDDDTAESVRRRLSEYKKQTAPLLGYYDKQGVLKSFDGSENPELVEKNRRSDAIYKSLKVYLEQKH